MTQIAQVSIISGSVSDKEFVTFTSLKLLELGVRYEARVLSAHRDLTALQEYIVYCNESNVKVFIALAGMAAALPGVVAACTDKPVIGVPLPGSHLNGMDSLYSIVQMPKGVPVATMAIGNHGAINAAIFAHKILNIA